MKGRNETLDEMAKILPVARHKVYNAVREIVALADGYRNRNGSFSFDLYPELDREVNAILIALSDSLIEDAEKRARKVLETLDYDLDEEEVISEAEEGEKGALWAFDMHCTNLKNTIEAFIAVGFAEATDKQGLIEKILSYLRTPSAATWKDAVKKKLIDPNELRFGRGYMKNIPKAVTLTEQEILQKVLVNATAQHYAEDSRIIGVRIFRGSNYDCPYCDSLLGIVWPLNNIPIPAHIRCCCYMEPVYRN